MSAREYVSSSLSLSLATSGAYRTSPCLEGNVRSTRLPIANKSHPSPSRTDLAIVWIAVLLCDTVFFALIVNRARRLNRLRGRLFKLLLRDGEPKSFLSSGYTRHANMFDLSQARNTLRMRPCLSVSSSCAYTRIDNSALLVCHLANILTCLVRLLPQSRCALYPFADYGPSRHEGCTGESGSTVYIVVGKKSLYLRQPRSSAGISRGQRDNHKRVSIIRFRGVHLLTSFLEMWMCRIASTLIARLMLNLRDPKLAAGSQCWSERESTKI